jgi:hypothetical protein
MSITGPWWIISVAVAGTVAPAHKRAHDNRQRETNEETVRDTGEHADAEGVMIRRPVRVVVCSVTG